MLPVDYYERSKSKLQPCRENPELPPRLIDDIMLSIEEAKAGQVHRVQIRKVIYVILLLDFDGVMYPVNQTDPFWRPERLARVLCDFPSVDIVISSAWRKFVHCSRYFAGPHCRCDACIPNR